MFNVESLKIFKDNYVWLIKSNDGKIIVVDPGESEAVDKFLMDNKFVLAAIFITHHHKDHTGGVLSLQEKYQVPVYGSKKSNITTISHSVDDGDIINIDSMNLQAHVMAIPGHTLDHIAYVVDDKLFCGDTLFSAGCGRIFEGNYEQMLSSLAKIASLKPETKLYCGHEYTLNNLLFAIHYDPANVFLQQYLDEVKEKTHQNIMTLPSILAIEKKINPFLRCLESDFVDHINKLKNENFKNSLETFAYLRELKNQF